MKWLRTRWLLLLFTPLALSACVDETPAYRYRLKVEVDTPDGVKSGSSVIEVETAISRGIPSPGSVMHRLRGEAVAVEVTQGKVLFALLRSPGNIGWAENIMFLLSPPAPLEAEDHFLRRYRGMRSMDERFALPQSYMSTGFKSRSTGIPMLVTFGDLLNPLTVREVNPEDLASEFGSGTRLRRITVEMTTDLVTTGIEERLPWLPQTYSTMLDGERTNHIKAKYRLANCLSQGDFSQGILN